MKKRTIAAVALFAGCAALLITFAVKTAMDRNYFTTEANSAPFSLQLTVNALGLIFPAAILASVALFLLKKPRALWIVGGVCAAAAVAVAIVCVTDHGGDLGLENGTPMSAPVETVGVGNDQREFSRLFQENG